jgi:hypothetical protein
MAGEFNIPEKQIRCSNEKGVKRGMPDVRLSGINAYSSSAENVFSHSHVRHAVGSNVIGVFKDPGAESEGKKAIKGNNPDAFISKI